MDGRQSTARRRGAEERLSAGDTSLFARQRPEGPLLSAEETEQFLAVAPQLRLRRQVRNHHRQRQSGQRHHGQLPEIAPLPQSGQAERLDDLDDHHADDDKGERF